MGFLSKQRSQIEQLGSEIDEIYKSKQQKRGLLGYPKDWTPEYIEKYESYKRNGGKLDPITWKKQYDDFMRKALGY